MLVAEAHRLAILFSPVIEIALVAFEDRLRHVTRMQEAALVAPTNEIGQVARTVLDRGVGVVLDPQCLPERGGERNKAGRVASIANGHDGLAPIAAGHQLATVFLEPVAVARGTATVRCTAASATSVLFPSPRQLADTSPVSLVFLPGGPTCAITPPTPAT